MAYTSDAYATMLLTMALSPNREEYARPYSTQEFFKLEQRVRESSMHGVGDLVGIDISGLMMRLNISEEEGYRIYTLLNRAVQLGYAIEKFMIKGIDVVTVHNEEYPERLRRKMKHAAPPFFYLCGNAQLIGKPAVAIVGISGVKTTPEVREGVEKLVRDAAQMGYTVVTGGELGVSRVAAAAVLQYGGAMIDVLGGGMSEHLGYEPVQQLMQEGRMAVLSMEHPEAMFTVTHAIARNKVLFALSDAAFVCNTDNKRGETDALHNHYCDWIYALSSHPNNNALITRGAIPIADLRSFDFVQTSQHWRGSQAVQMNIFDLF